MEIKKGMNSFYVGDSEENPKAQMEYKLLGEDVVEIHHTEVSQELQGEGVGKELLSELVDWARTENMKILPSCPYAEKQLKKNPEYDNMIYKDN